MDWQTLLGYQPGNTRAQVRAKYRALALKYHPDRYKYGNAKMKELTRAWEEYQEYLRSPQPPQQPRRSTSNRAQPPYHNPTYQPTDARQEAVHREWAKRYEGSPDDTIPQWAWRYIDPRTHLLKQIESLQRVHARMPPELRGYLESDLQIKMAQLMQQLGVGFQPHVQAPQRVGKRRVKSGAVHKKPRSRGASRKPRAISRLYSGPVPMEID